MRVEIQNGTLNDTSDLIIVYIVFATELFRERVRTKKGEQGDCNGTLVRVRLDDLLLCVPCLTGRWRESVHSLGLGLVVSVGKLDV